MYLLETDLGFKSADAASYSILLIQTVILLIQNWCITVCLDLLSIALLSRMV